MYTRCFLGILGFGWVFRPLKVGAIGALEGGAARFSCDTPPILENVMPQSVARQVCCSSWSTQHLRQVLVRSNEVAGFGPESEVSQEPCY